MAKTNDEKVADLLAKTIEAGCTPDEEASAVRQAELLVRQYGLDVDAFRASVEAIGGDEARYAFSDKGFLMEADAIRTVERVVEGRARGKVRGIVEDMLLQGAATDAILAEVVRQVPDAQTTKGCVSWYKSKMVGRGLLPKRGAAPAEQPAAG